jgi:hypothetical protein
MTNIVGAEPDQLTVGMALMVDFEALNDEITAPVFRLA